MSEHHDRRWLLAAAALSALIWAAIVRGCPAVFN